MNWFMVASGLLNIGAAIWAISHGNYSYGIVYAGWAVGNLTLSRLG